VCVTKGQYIMFKVERLIGEISRSLFLYLNRFVESSPHDGILKSHLYELISELIDSESLKMH